MADAEIIVLFASASMTGPPDTEVCHGDNQDLRSDAPLIGTLPA